MFIIRQALPQDLDDLHALAKQTFFINLPPDRDIIAHKIEQSVQSFRRLATDRPHASSRLASGPSKVVERSAARGRKAVEPTAPARIQAPDTNPGPRSSGAGTSGGGGASGLRHMTEQGDLFLFVLEDVEGRGVIGTSQVIAHMGGPGHPRYFMTLTNQACQSRSLGIGWNHLVGRMGHDEAGPTEIGGLILNHAFRGHPRHLGRLLSFVRFHLIGLHRKHFADTIIAEMLGPITRTGYNPFYEKFTRHFVTRAFADVYRFSQTSREFLHTLVPKGDIYLSILDPEVANAAGEVGDDTRPARRLLERLGFEYHHRIDPLDGGPHLEARTSDIAIVKQTRRVEGLIAAAERPRRSAGEELLLSVLDRQGNFQALQCEASVSDSRARVSREIVEALRVESPVAFGVTPLSFE